MNNQGQPQQQRQATSPARPRGGRIPWASSPPGGHVLSLPSSGPSDRPVPEPAGSLPRPPDSEYPLHAADLAARPAALVHELVVAAETDRDEARGLACRLAASLSPEARLVLLDALAEADAIPDDDRPPGPGTCPTSAYRTGGEVSCDAPERTVPPALCRLSFLPTYPEHRPDRPAGAPECGAPGLWQAASNDPPDALIRLRFADAFALERAGAAFGAESGPGLGDAWSDPATLTLRIPGGAGVEALRAVLAVLDAAALVPESLTVHTHELDDVFAAFTGLL